MQMSDAKKLIGKMCAVYWSDRTGQSIRTVSRIHDATYVPMYGGYLITDRDDLALERILAVELLETNGATIPFFGSASEVPAAA